MHQMVLRIHSPALRYYFAEFANRVTTAHFVRALYMCVKIYITKDALPSSLISKSCF